MSSSTSPSPKLDGEFLRNRFLSVLPSLKPDQKEADVAAMASNNRADFQGAEREKDAVQKKLEATPGQQI